MPAEPKKCGPTPAAQGAHLPQPHVPAWPLASSCSTSSPHLHLLLVNRVTVQHTAAAKSRCLTKVQPVSFAFMMCSLWGEAAYRMFQINDTWHSPNAGDRHCAKWKVGYHSCICRCIVYAQHKHAIGKYNRGIILSLLARIRAQSPFAISAATLGMLRESPTEMFTAKSGTPACSNCCTSREFTT